MDLLPPALRGTYEPLASLGSGGMGHVVLARDRLLGRQVAIKVVKAAGDAALDRRFLREARVLASLDHPNIVRVFQFGSDPQQGSYIVMEYVPGESLDRFSGTIDPVACLLQIADALETMHAAGLIHRDLKPGNMMRRASGEMVLIDFGLVEDPEQTPLTRTGGIVGTLAFMAPEICRGEVWTPAADWFAWGVSLYWLCEDRLPFSAPQLMQIAGGRDLKPSFGRVPAGGGVEILLRRMLSTDPSDRPRSRHEIEEILREGGGGTGVIEVKREPMTSPDASTVDDLRPDDATRDLRPTDVPAVARWLPTRPVLLYLLCLVYLALSVSAMLPGRSPQEVRAIPFLLALPAALLAMVLARFVARKTPQLMGQCLALVATSTLLVSVAGAMHRASDDLVRVGLVSSASFQLSFMVILGLTAVGMLRGLKDQPGIRIDGGELLHVVQAFTASSVALFAGTSVIEVTKATHMLPVSRQALELIHLLGGTSADQQVSLVRAGYAFALLAPVPLALGFHAGRRATRLAGAALPPLFPPLFCMGVGSYVFVISGDAELLTVYVESATLFLAAAAAHATLLFLGSRIR